MINTEIRLFDSMSPVLKNIISSVDAMIKSLENCEKASEGMIDKGVLDKANEAFRQAVEGVHGLDEALIEAKVNSESAGSSIEGLSSSVANSEGLMHRAASAVKKLALGYLSFQGIKNFIQGADEFQNVSTRLNMVANSFKETETELSGVELMARIRKSASESRGEFMMTADVIGKLGMQARNAFESSDDLITFAEQLNKNFKIAGTDAEGIRSVMYNLTQALASGVLRGQDLNSVMSNAPIILEKVAKYMDSDISQIRKLAEEGKLSSSVIVSAMLASAEKTNKQFEKMPMNFHDIMTKIKNSIQASLSGAFIKWNELLNSENMQKTIEFLINLVSGFVNVVSEVFGVLIDIFGPILGFFNEFSGVIEIAVGALMAYQLAVWAVNTAMTVFNITCNANPIILIITAVLTLIMLLFKWIQSLGGLTLAWLKFKLVVLNIFGALGMAIGGFIGVIASAILGIIQVILHAVQFMLNVLIKGINLVIKGLNLIPGVNISEVGEVKFANGFDDFAKGLRDGMGDMLVNSGKSIDSASQGISNEIKLKEAEIAKQKEAEKADPLKDLKIPPYEKNLGSIDKGMGKAAGHAGSIDKKLDDGLEVNSDDLKAIRDVMFQRAIQNLSWDKIDVHVDNSFGDVHETADTDSIIKSIEDGLYEAVERVGVMA